MSRIGRMPVTVPANVTVTIDGQSVTVKGPKGELSHVVAEPIAVEFADGVVAVTRPDDERLSRSLHGLTRTLINNMVIGVTDGFEKKMEIRGTGYRVLARGSSMEFALGYSHSITVDPPQGIDKQLVGETAANIRKLRKPDAYKGKGVRYADEVVRLKAGKTGKK